MFFNFLQIQVTDRSGTFSAWVELKDPQVYNWIAAIRHLNQNLTEAEQQLADNDNDDSDNGNNIQSNKKRSTILADNDSSYHYKNSAEEKIKSRDANAILLLFCGQVCWIF